MYIYEQTTWKNNQIHFFTLSSTKCLRNPLSATLACHGRDESKHSALEASGDIKVRSKEAKTGNAECDDWTSLASPFSVLRMKCPPELLVQMWDIFPRGKLAKLRLNWEASAVWGNHEWRILGVGCFKTQTNWIFWGYCKRLVCRRQEQPNQEIKQQKTPLSRLSKFWSEEAVSTCWATRSRFYFG